VDVISFEWEPRAYRALQVTYVTVSEILDVPHTVGVWEYDGSSFKAQFGVYPVTEAAIAFNVVPAPATAILLAAAGATQRRRRT
jgi:MprA protease rhombosortase-interaction domain-containing protein